MGLCRCRLQSKKSDIPPIQASHSKQTRTEIMVLLQTGCEMGSEEDNGIKKGNIGTFHCVPTTTLVIFQIAR
jgi:hypothetical protein